ncbi:MAG: DUF4268 domain-containing protein [Akkermansia sp.]|nr:DUF4268 domain-containing protein [Akkermansia sp.]
MKGSEFNFIRFIEGVNNRFIIPVYQRNYDWKIENCKQLYDDLVKIVKQRKKSHFFGSVVSQNAPGKYVNFLIIDGQQRLTTISLLLLAIYNLINEGAVIPRDERLKERIYELYLVDKCADKENRIKLRPVKNDRLAYEKLFSEPAEYIRESNLTVNYEFFRDEIKNSELTVDEIFEAIGKLDIINIQLEQDDEPQLIFESLNSTGLDLSESDKIRNYILMGQPLELQNEYYDKFWNKIEILTQYDASFFIRDYLSVKLQSIPKQKRIYGIFKEFVESRILKIEELLTDLLEYAKRYSLLLGAKSGIPALDACIYRLNHLETTVTRPFFLEVLRMYDENKINQKQVTEVFQIAENYLFRRSICDLPTNALNKIFLMLHREIVRYDGTEANYVEKYKFALLNKREKSRFPDDVEFRAEFSSRQVYLMNRKNKVYMLERLENFGTIEDKNVYSRCDDGIYSIEHIMPQHLTPAWRRELGDDAELIHETWLHRMANLTLTAYNSQYSNRSFAEKKSIENGFDDSGIRMNMWISKKDKWTLAELEERNEYLAHRALSVWALPETEFKPAEKQMDSCTLEEEASSLSGRKIARFSFKNTEYPVTSWTEMYQKVLQLLMDMDKSIIMRLAASEDDMYAKHFCFKEGDLTKYAELGNHVYVWINNNTQTKLSVLDMLFKRYDIEPMDLTFYLRDEKEGDDVDALPRYERRRKYWTYALEYLHAAHGDGAFSNVNPTKQNWINGFVGISGVCLCCVANRDGARVELYIGKDNAETNKRIFDLLYSRRLEIEANMGKKLTWKRNDEVKNSKIEITLGGVSIENEADWPAMAQFHAEWSKKFNDVMVPLISG